MRASSTPLLPDTRGRRRCSITEPIDAVLLGAEWIAANGDTANVIGSRAVAELAAGRRRHGPVPVYVCAPITTYDPDDAGRRRHPRRAAPGA